MPHPSPRAAAYGLAFLVSIAMACDLLWMPVQLADSVGEILDAQRSPSVWASFTGSFGTEAYLRPLRIAQIKVLFDAAQGQHYWLVYRGFHAVLLVAAVLLFTRALRVSTIVDFAAAAFALAVLTGLQTFRGTIQEAFPINHFLEILFFCLIALNLAQSRGGIWIDAAAALIFVMAVLTLESGLLVWVVAAAAWAAGWRGISARGLAVMTVCLLGYLYVRFVYLSSGVPTLAERSSGYLVSILDPPELQRRFGEQPLVFYGYNVAASAMSVLFSEPQSGVFVTVRAWLDDRVMPRVVLPIATSLVTTALIAWAGISRARLRASASARQARREPFDDTARFILIFAAVLAANAVLSFAYTKDDIMSTAGAFYALAAFGAVREGLLVVAEVRPQAKGIRPHDTGRLKALSRPVMGGLIPFALVLVLLAIGWSVRSAGIHFVLRSQAIKHQVDWVEMPGRWRRNGQWPSDPARERLILLLRDEAVRVALPNTRVDRPEWPVRLWME